MCVFKLALESKHESLLNIDIDKLSEATVKSCFDFNLQEDYQQDRISNNDLLRWANRAGGKIF